MGLFKFLSVFDWITPGIEITDEIKEVLRKKENNQQLTSVDKELLDRIMNGNPERVQPKFEIRQSDFEKPKEWMCDHCGTPQPMNNRKCDSCGASRGFLR